MHPTVSHHPAPMFRPVSRLSTAAIVVLLLTGCAKEPLSPRDRILPPQFILSWGTNGDGPGEFDFPRGVALDAEGHVYVADAMNHRVQKFDANGRWLKMWGSEGAGDGQFEGAWAVVVDGAGLVYVADRNNHRIQQFDSDGRFIRKWGSWGIEPGLFSHPRGLAVDDQGHLYTLEGHFSTDSNRVQKFDSEGRLLAAWGSFGKAPGQFDFTVGPAEEFGHSGPGARLLGGRGCSGILGVTIDLEGHIAVSDLGNNRIETFDRTGHLLRTWGSGGDGEGRFLYPQGLAVDPQGRFYVVDSSESFRIQIFDSRGRFLTAFGGVGSGPGQFLEHPMGIAIDRDGYIFVADSGNGRIEKFAPPIPG